MKPFSILAPLAIFSMVFMLIFAVLTHDPAAQAAAPAVAAAASIETVESAIAQPNAEHINVTGSQAAGLVSSAVGLEAYPGLEQFAAQNINGRAGDVVGVYVRDIMALPVTQQPEGQSDYVAAEHNLLTEFQIPKRYSAVGILAHNYLSGSRFSQLSAGMEILLVFGDGRVARYTVTGAELYQALEPNSPVSDFVDPGDPTQKVMTSGELFQKIYTTPNQVVFQTCFEAYGDPSWGRIFVTAQSAGPLDLSVPLMRLPGLN